MSSQSEICKFKKSIVDFFYKGPLLLPLFNPPGSLSPLHFSQQTRERTIQRYFSKVMTIADRKKGDRPPVAAVEVGAVMSTRERVHVLQEALSLGLILEEDA